MEEFSRLSEIEENYALLLEAVERLVSNIAPTTSLEDILKELSISDDELANAKDAVIE